MRGFPLIRYVSELRTSAVVAVAVMTVVPSPARADCAWTFEQEWGSNGSGAGEFAGPQGMKFNSLGELHVTDAVNNRVQVFDADGNHIRSFGTFGSTDGRFHQPHDLDFDSSDNIYVADRINNRMQKFDAVGNYITQWGSFGTADGQFDEPWGVAVNDQGHVFVAERSGNRVQKFTSDGTWLLTFGGLGNLDGEMDGPRGMDFTSDGTLYVAEIRNNRVSVFTPEGVFLFKWGRSGGIPGRFHNPNALQIDDQDFVHVLCWYTKDHNARFQRFTPSGTFVCGFLGTQGVGPLQFDHAQGLAIGPGPSFYISDTLNHRVQRIGEDFVTSAGLPMPLESWTRQKSRFRVGQTGR